MPRTKKPTKVRRRCRNCETRMMVEVENRAVVVLKCPGCGWMAVEDLLPNSAVKLVRWFSKALDEDANGRLVKFWLR